MKELYCMQNNGNYSIWEKYPKLTMDNYLDENEPLVVLDRYTWKLLTDNKPSPKDGEVINIRMEINLGWEKVK